MTQKTVRCQHCMCEYQFYTSGYGGPQSDMYCQDCWEVVQLALDGVPVKFGYIGVESDVPVETLLAEEVKQKTERDSNTPVFRRVYPGMFNSVNGSRQSIRDIIYNGSNYCISTWSENDEPPNASKVIWANLVTKEPAKRFEER